MATKVPPEIGANYRPGGIALVGRDPGANEVRLGKPFVGLAGSVLDSCLAAAGIQREACAITNVVPWRPPNNNFHAHRREHVERGQQELREFLDEHGPGVVVALGNEASFALTSQWPTKDGTIFGAKGIEERRGYIFRGHNDLKVIATVHPSYAQRVWVPWVSLLTRDLMRAKEEKDVGFQRPTRDVVIPRSEAHAVELARELGQAKELGADIEIHDDQRFACIGFSDRVDRSVVFPRRYLDQARTLLERRDLRTIWHNGQFDLHFLYTRCGIRVATALDDTQLAWHACYPQLAGKADQSSAQMTRKSLSFLASLYVRDEFWKNYAFETEHERYVLNGRDCCITLQIMQELRSEIAALDVEDIYRHEIDLIWPCVEMQARGLKVDEQERKRRIEALSAQEETLNDRLNDLVVPIVEQRQDRLQDSFHLFESKWTCPCCRNGSGKRDACWSCAGFEDSPTKADLEERYGNPDGLLKAELEAKHLAPCAECKGKGQREWLEFNPNSSQQICAVLYDALKLPPRYSGGSLTATSEKLKSLLPYVS